MLSKKPPSLVGGSKDKKALGGGKASLAFVVVGLLARFLLYLMAFSHRFFIRSRSLILRALASSASIDRVGRIDAFWLNILLFGRCALWPPRPKTKGLNIARRVVSKEY